MIQNLRNIAWKSAFLSLMIASADLLAWSSPADLSSAGANDNPISAMDASGNGLVVWLSGTSPNITIKAATYISGIWSSPIDLAGPDSYGFPALQVDAAGNAMVVWEHFSDGAHEVQAVNIPFNSSPGSILTLSFSGDNRHPSIVLDDSGNGFSIWEDRTTDQIFAAQLHNYNTWTAPVVVSQGGGLFIPDGSMSTTGHAISYWYCTGTCTGKTSTFTNGSWVDDGSIDHTYCPIWDQIVIDVDPNGNALAVWIEDQNSEVVSSYRPVGQSWGAAVTVSDDIFNSFHSVKMDPSGNGVAAWINNDQNIVQAASFVSGTWQSPVVISDQIGNQTAFITVADDGDATTIYQDLNGGVIKIVELPFGGSWSTPLQISDNIGYSFNPYISGNGNGNSIAVWVNSDGTDNIIQVSVN